MANSLHDQRYDSLQSELWDLKAEHRQECKERDNEINKLRAEMSRIEQDAIAHAANVTKAQCEKIKTLEEENSVLQASNREMEGLKTSWETDMEGFESQRSEWREKSIILDSLQNEKARWKKDRASLSRLREQRKRWTKHAKRLLAFRKDWTKGIALIRELKKKVSDCERDATELAELKVTLEPLRQKLVGVENELVTMTQARDEEVNKSCQLSSMVDKYNGLLFRMTSSDSLPSPIHTERFKSLLSLPMDAITTNTVTRPLLEFSSAYWDEVEPTKCPTCSGTDTGSLCYYAYLVLDSIESREFGVEMLHLINALSRGITDSTCNYTAAMIFWAVVELMGVEKDYGPLIVEDGMPLFVLAMMHLTLRTAERFPLLPGFSADSLNTVSVAILEYARTCDVLLHPLHDYVLKGYSESSNFFADGTTFGIDIGHFLVATPAGKEVARIEDNKITLLHKKHCKWRFILPHGILLSIGCQDLQTNSVPHARWIQKTINHPPTAEEMAEALKDLPW